MRPSFEFLRGDFNTSLIARLLNGISYWNFSVANPFSKCSILCTLSGVVTRTDTFFRIRSGRLSDLGAIVE